MLNRKLAIVLFVFVFLGIGGIIIYDYLNESLAINLTSNSIGLTGGAVADNLADSVMLSPVKLQKCGIFNKCPGGFFCETSNHLCAPINRCDPKNNDCINKNYGFYCKSITVNRQSFNACRTECTSDRSCKSGFSSDLCNKDLGRCVECIKDGDCNKFGRTGYTCNDKGECVAGNTNSVCGNGIKEGDEECDLGNNQNGFPGSGCSKDCKKIAKLSGRCDEKWSLTNMEGCAEGQVCIDNLCKINDNINWPPPNRPDDDQTLQTQTNQDQDVNVDYDLICLIAPELCEDISCPDGGSDNAGYSYFCQSSCTSGGPVGLTCTNGQLKCCRQKNVGQNNACKNKYGNGASCQSTESCKESGGTSHPGFCLAGGLSGDLNVQCCSPPGSGDTSKKCVSPISYAPVRFNAGVHNTAGHSSVRCGSSYCAVDLSPSDTCEGARTKALSGVSIVSPINGRVSEVFSISPFGSCIVINSANSDSNAAVLCHIDTNKKVGDSVNAGDNIGKLASWNCQSNSFGPHLHLELKLNGNWISGDGMSGTWTNQKNACNNYN